MKRGHTSYRRIAKAGLVGKTGLIYTHYKGELADARRRRARNPLYQEAERLDSIAESVQAQAWNSYHELRKKAPSDK